MQANPKRVLFPSLDKHSAMFKDEARLINIVVFWTPRSRAAPDIYSVLQRV